MKRLIMLIIAVLLLTAAAENSESWLYMVNVGKGDAILIHINDRTYLIDAGKAAAWDRVEAALEKFNITVLDGVFLTHTDKDHSGGLKKLSKSDIEVKSWYAPALDREDNPIIKAAERRDAEVTWLSAGDVVDEVFYVLGPLCYNKTEENDNSLVMRLVTPCGNVLLTGDMEQTEEATLLAVGTDFSCTVFKVPNHADDDVCSNALLYRLGAQIALISTDPYEKPGTPDEKLVTRLEALGMEIYRTDLSSGGILVTFTENGVEVQVD